MPRSIYPDLAGKLVIVTGGGRGIGLAAVRRFLEQGSEVVVVDLRMTAGELGEPDADGWRGVTGDVACEFAELDVADLDSVRVFAAALARRHGAPDVVLNAAGIVRGASAEEMPGNDWRDVIDVNLSGIFYMTQALGNAMLANERGSIVNIGSMSGIISNYPQKQVSYNVSKAGVIHLSRTVAAEWAGRGVRVNSVSPGYIGTDMTIPNMAANPDWTEAWLERVPIGRVGTPDEVVAVILFLASDASSYVVGSDLVVDGGYTVW
jgi:NAD(P)-dependent dehydrogenase (short-subunit alcohol dehydrogenase family)